MIINVMRLSCKCSKRRRVLCLSKRQWTHTIDFAPLFVSGIVYCQPHFRGGLFTTILSLLSPLSPLSRPQSLVAGPIWSALGELSTGAGNCGVLRARLICISTASLLADGLLSGRILSFIEINKLQFLIFLISRKKSKSFENIV